MRLDFGIWDAGWWEENKVGLFACCCSLLDRLRVGEVVLFFFEDGLVVGGELAEL